MDMEGLAYVVSAPVGAYRGKPLPASWVDSRPIQEMAKASQNNTDGGSGTLCTIICIHLYLYHTHQPFYGN